jgi:V8-like Glu-specific endopeptidase
MEVVMLDKNDPSRRDKSVEFSEGDSGAMQGVTQLSEPLDIDEDSPGDGFGTLELVPGYEPRRLLRMRLNAPTTPQDWNGYPHLDQERRRVYAEQYPDWHEERHECSEEPSHDYDPGYERYDESGELGHIEATGSRPWRWICQLVVTDANDRKLLATGWLAAPHLVITAGRCIFEPGVGPARRIEVIPGLDGPYRPYGSTTSRRFATVQGWIEQRDPSCDYGCIFLSDAFAGIGHFGLGQYTNSGLLGQIANNAGYPDFARGTPCFEACAVADAEDRTIAYRASGYELSVGSPVWMQAERGNRRQRLVCGMIGSGDPSRAIRISGKVLEIVRNWKATSNLQAKTKSAPQKTKTKSGPQETKAKKGPEETKGAPPGPSSG